MIVPPSDEASPKVKMPLTVAGHGALLGREADLVADGDVVLLGEAGVDGDLAGPRRRGRRPSS